MKTNKKGFTLVEIMIVVAIIALLAAIAIPSFLKSRLEARKSTCINSMRLIDHAKEQWATTYNKNIGDKPEDTDILPYMKGGTDVNGQALAGAKLPVCPNGLGGYTISVIGTDPVCPNAGTYPDHVLPHL